MIADGISPTQNVYFIGASVIRYFDAHSKFEVDFDELHAAIKKEYKCSTKLLWLSLTWLYVLGIVDANDQGEITYVS